MGAIFNQAQAALAKYWYERIPYTYGPVALPTGLSTVFTASQWTDTRHPDWVAELVGVWVTQNAGVQLNWIYDDDTANQGASQGYADAAPAGVRRMPLSAPAIRLLQLQVNNTSGGVIAGFQLTYEVAMRKLSVAEKMLRGYGLSTVDQYALKLLNDPQISGERQVADLVDRGSLPVDMEAQLQRTWRNRRLRDHALSGVYHVTPGGNTTISTLTVPPGEFLVLEELAVEGGSALASTLNVYVDRDGDLSYLQVTANAFAQADDAPWQVWLPAMQQLTVRASTQGALANVPIRIRVGRYKLSSLLRVRFGLVRSERDLPGDTYAKALVGIS